MYGLIFKNMNKRIDDYIKTSKAISEAEIESKKAISEAEIESKKAISEAEIKSKDRVDISLAEYEALKKENLALRERAMHAEYILKQMYIDPKVVEKIDPSTVRRCEMVNPMDFTKHIRIEFDVSVVGFRDI